MFQLVFPFSFQTICLYLMIRKIEKQEKEKKIERERQRETERERYSVWEN